MMLDRTMQLVELMIEIKRLASQTSRSLFQTLFHVLSTGVESSYLEEYSLEELEEMEQNHLRHLKID